MHRKRDRRFDHRVTSGGVVATALWAALMAGGVAAEANQSPDLDKGSPVPILPGVTVMGRLEPGDRTLKRDESYFDVYVLEGEMGRTATVVMRAEFDAYLMLADEDGDVIARDDDSAGGSDARIIYTFPSSGSYLIVANAYEAGATGRYLLRAEVSGLGRDGAVIDEALKPLPLFGSPYRLMRPGGWYRGEATDETVVALFTERDDDPYPCLSVKVEDLARHGVRDVEALFERLAAVDDASPWEVVSAGWATVNGVSVHRSITVASTPMGRIQTLRLILPWGGLGLVVSFQDRASDFSDRLPLFEALAGTLAGARKE